MALGRMVAFGAKRTTRAPARVVRLDGAILSLTHNWALILCSFAIAPTQSGAASFCVPQGTRGSPAVFRSEETPDNCRGGPRPS
jgi:hypothetical protein